MVSAVGAYAMDKAVPLRASMGRDYLFSGQELAGAEFPFGYDERAAAVRVKVGALETVATERFIPGADDFAEIEVLPGALVDVYATGAGGEPVPLPVARGCLPNCSVKGLPRE